MLQLVVNVLGTLVAGLCAVLLLRAYGSVRNGLLLWAGLCFAGLARVERIVGRGSFRRSGGRPLSLASRSRGSRDAAAGLWPHF